MTTVIDFAIPYGEESLEDAFDNWTAKAKPKACVDYCFHMAITNWDRHGPEMAEMVAEGCPTFKEFMIYASEGWQSDDRAIFNTLERCKRARRDAAGPRRVEPRARRADRPASHARADEQARRDAARR